MVRWYEGGGDGEIVGGDKGTQVPGPLLFSVHTSVLHMARGTGSHCANAKGAPDLHPQAGADGARHLPPNLTLPKLHGGPGQ